jgi:glutathione synthase/RimK-type ligase-like ATP-grasp enzyme
LMSARQASLLFAIGSDQRAEKLNDGRPKYRGCTDLHLLFDKREPVHVLPLDRHMLRQRRRPELHPYRCILNLITDPDQNPKTLENLRKLLRGFSGPVINPPEAVIRSTRDQVAKLLGGTPGLIAPKTVRVRNARPDLVAGAIVRAEMRFPLIVRLAGTHTGMIVGLFDEMDDLRASITQPGEHIVTEFVDSRSDDGLYRKYRAFFIGEGIIFRHMLVSDAWNVHASDRTRFMAERPGLLAEEQAMFEQAEHAFPSIVLETLEAVRERMPLDYFGMDFGILPDGRLVLFEANATMNFFPFLPDPRFEYVKQCVGPARQAFHEMLGRSAAHALAPPNLQLSL